VEKLFSKSSSLEVSFVQGELNSFLLTDRFEYSGILVRAKKYLTVVDLGKVSPYAALYLGNLKRSFQTAGRVDNSGYLGFSSTDFSANSLRGVAP
jgi:hypothetical protein